MNPILRNILAVLVGLFVGAAFNGVIISISASVIPPSAGADLTTMETLKASMHLMEPRHFIMPFLAHALGTLVGALLTAFLVASHKMRFALGIGACFTLAGLINVFMLPSPLWFTLLDIIVAYIPMGYIAGKLMERKQQHVSS